MFPPPASRADAGPLLADVRSRIARAASAAGRTDAPILVAVSKQQPWDRIAPILAAGQQVFGENRVQEAAERWRDRRADYPDLQLRLIGPLQTNKAAQAVGLFDAIETLDRERLARALADAVQAQGRAPTILIQVNTGEEPQKAGVSPADLPALLAAAEREYGLAVSGLMCIPPAAEPPGPHFALLAKLAARLGLSKLSMGMSDDFEIAVRFGATSVRLGSALFGARTHPLTAG